LILNLVLPEEPIDENVLPAITAEAPDSEEDREEWDKIQPTTSGKEAQVKVA
jgi:hypothetical protein